MMAASRSVRTLECRDRRLQLRGRVGCVRAGREIDRIAEDDLDIATPAVRALAVPLAVQVVEDGDAVDLELHWYDRARALDRDESRAGLEGLSGTTDGELALGVNEHREPAIEPRPEQLEAAADRAFPCERERVGEDRAERSVQLVAEDVVGGRRDGETPPPGEGDSHDDDAVVPVKAVVRCKEHRTIEPTKLLETGHLHVIEEVDQRVEQGLLKQDAEAPHQRVKRPAKDPTFLPGVARRGHHALEVADGRVGEHRGIVDVRAELFLDDAEKIDTPERIEPDVLGELRLRVDAFRGHVRDLHDDPFDLAQLARRSCRGDWFGLAASAGEEALDDLALLDLLSRRRREFRVWPDRPPADLLTARELRVRVADDLIDRGAVLRLKEHRVDLQRLAGALETDDRGEHRPLRRRDLLEPRVGGEDVFDVLGIHLEAVGERDHVLLPSVQPEEAVRVELAKVAGVEPAILVDRRAGGFLVLPVALEDVRSVRDDLALVGDLHQDAGQGNADRAQAVTVETVEGERG